MSDASLPPTVNRIDAEMLLQQGVQAAMQGQPGQAAQCWQRTLALCGDADLQTQAYFNLGVLCRKCGEPESAVACLHQALLADEANHEAREQLATLLADRGEVLESIAQFEKLVETQPEARHYFNLGILYSTLGEGVQAETHYRSALTLMPAHAESLSNLGLLLAERGLTGEALSCLKRAVAIAEQSPQAHANLAQLLEADDQLDVAAHCLERAVALKPEDAGLHCDLAVLRTEQRRLDEAESGFRRALQLDPAHRSAKTFLGQFLLAQGRFAEGWPLHEARFGRNATAGRPLLPTLATPAWQGDALHGKTLLLRQEQGFGDEIQFIRYLPRLLAFAPAKIRMQCWSALHPLFSGLPGIELHAETDAVPSHDVWISTMSLPLYCGSSDIPDELPYLQAPAERVDAWRKRLGSASAKLRVGLLWQGHRLHGNDAHRSLPSVEVLAPLWQVDGIEFYSLQRETVETGLSLRQFGAEIADFGDAAALIMQLDLVISVDSAYAHLAGALGKPVWVLLPACRTDWRWGYEGTTSPWYPNVMRLFRQPHRGGWSELVPDVLDALSDLRTGRVA